MGIALLLKKRIEQQVIKMKIILNRRYWLLMVQLNGPTSSSDDNDIEQFTTLRWQNETLNKSHFTISISEFNAEVESANLDNIQRREKHGLSISNEKNWNVI